MSGKLVAVIGDEDTVTGFLLAGVGFRDVSGTNFLVVNSSTPVVCKTKGLCAGLLGHSR